MTAAAEPPRFVRVDAGPRPTTATESWHDQLAGLLWFTLRRLTPPELVCHLAVGVRVGDGTAVALDLAVLRRDLVGMPGQAVAPDAVLLAIDLSPSDGSSPDRSSPDGSSPDGSSPDGFSPGRSLPGHARGAAAGTPYLWWVENHDDRPVVHAFARDPGTGRYAPHGVFRDVVLTDRPFPISFPLAEITPR